MTRLLIGDKCGAHTVPYIEVKNNSSRVEHEATTSKVDDDQLFYCRQRGMDEEEAVALVVNGFCKEVLQALPMEFAMEAQQLGGDFAGRLCGLNHGQYAACRRPDFAGACATSPLHASGRLYDGADRIDDRVTVHVAFRGRSGGVAMVGCADLIAGSGLGHGDRLRRVNDKIWSGWSGNQAGLGMADGHDVPT